MSAEGPSLAAGGRDESCDYDRFVDWEKRLAREAPFFERLFSERGVRRVVDVGCGSGRHAIMFASWGLDVVGVDPSSEMLASARRSSAETGSKAVFVEGGFGDLARLGLGPTDAVTCTGNALPHVDGVQGLRRALADMAAVLRRGGPLVLHLLNHARLIEGRIRAIPPVVRDDDEGTWVFLRVIDYPPEGIGFDFVTLHRPADACETGARWESTSRRSLHTALPVPLLAGELGSAGLGRIEMLGDHSRKSFDPGNDESVILVADSGPG
jgi:glycine/sarcosine N-methyltransferase